MTLPGASILNSDFPMLIDKSAKDAKIREGLEGLFVMFAYEAFPF